MKHFFTVLFSFLVLSLCAFSQIDTLIGWASLDGGVTGGEGGEVVTVTNETQLTSYLGYTSPTIIRVQDTIEIAEYKKLRVDGSNLTIEGLGSNATLKAGGLDIRGNNIIVRNLNIGDSYIDGHWDGKGDPKTDALAMSGTNIWIDHCNLYHSFDGLLDVVANGDVCGNLVTVSWTRFSQHNKVMLMGGDDEDSLACRGKLNVSIHHCWFDGTVTFYDSVAHLNYRLKQRLPRVRFGDVHVFNNYYEEVDDYCVAARIESDVVVENNFFRNAEDPHIIDDYGLGIEDPDLVATGNMYENTTGHKSTNGLAFDPSAHYAYPLDSVKAVPGLVLNYAGTQNRESNENPVAEDDTLTAQSSAVIDVLANDTDNDGDELRIAVILNEPVGEAYVSSNEIHYSPPADFAGTDSLYYQVVDLQGGVDTGLVKITVDTKIGIAQHSIDKNLKLYPNPAQNKLTVEFDASSGVPFSIDLLDITGRKIKTLAHDLIYPGTFSQEFDISGLRQGIYLCQVKTPARVITGKVLIIR